MRGSYLPLGHLGQVHLPRPPGGLISLWGRIRSNSQSPIRLPGRGSAARPASKPVASAQLRRAAQQHSKSLCPTVSRLLYLGYFRHGPQELHELDREDKLDVESNTAVGQRRDGAKLRGTPS